MENIVNMRRILSTPDDNLSMEDYTIIQRFLSNRDNFIVYGEFNELLYECVQDFYYNYLNRTEPIHREDEPEPIHRDDEPEPLTPLKSFKTDTCVICLTKEPNILFTDCRHIRICLECEEIKPLGKCPYCKVNISTKIII